MIWCNAGQRLRPIRLSAGPEAEAVNAAATAEKAAAQAARDTRRATRDAAEAVERIQHGFVQLDEKQPCTACHFNMTAAGYNFGRTVVFPYCEKRACVEARRKKNKTLVGTALADDTQAAQIKPPGEEQRTLEDRLASFELK